MDIKLNQKEVLLLQQILDESVGEVGVRIRHTRGPEARSELKRQRTLLRHLRGKLIPEQRTEDGSGLEARGGP